MTAVNDQELRSLFQHSYDLDAWRGFLHSHLGATHFSSKPQPVSVPASERERGLEGYLLGVLETSDGFKTGLFDFTVAGEQASLRRVGLRNLLVPWLKADYDAALVVFHPPAEGPWRFSFICDIKGEATAPKRFTYVFGDSDTPYRTPVERFSSLRSSRENQAPVSFKDMREAFSVEALSDEFFGKYKEHYEDFVCYITGKRYVKCGNKFVEKREHPPHSVLYPTFGRDDKRVRDYVKKLLGRLVFLHFLQKKGWLGASVGTWADGDRSFLLNLFEKSSPDQKADFLDGVLERLFFGALNTDRTADGDFFTTGVAGVGKCRVPYLNGGLFERDELDKLRVKFPVEFFERLLQFFAEYNFTIDENDPDEAEVGIDPEMLGRIFENLLEDNKEKGAFYTPKEIVGYMCRRALLAYLSAGRPEKEAAAIEAFLDTRDPAPLPPALARDLDNRLRDVKICDPAIGSGAFPMGLLRELHALRSALVARGKKEEYASALKRAIIENNVYGVDIEKGAVDIARLRFWLSLVVDEDEPSPLPNLDFKIMQGNSLVESWQGQDLSRLAEQKKDASPKEGAKDDAWSLSAPAFQLTLFENEADIHRKRLRELLHEWYSCSDHHERARLRTAIRTVAEEQIRATGKDLAGFSFGGLDPSANSEFFLWHVWFSEVFDDGGFDIVIGNPPYIKEYDNRAAFDVFRDESPYYIGKMDIWHGFACHGLDLLTPRGVLCLIAQNNWTTNAGAKKMRNKVLSEARILQMLDFNDYMVFQSAGIQTMVMLFRKDPSEPSYSFDLRTLGLGAEKEDFLAMLDGREIPAVRRLTPTIDRKKMKNKLLTFSEDESIFAKIAEGKTYLVDTEATNGIHTHHDCVSRKINSSFPDLPVGKGIFVLSPEEVNKLSLTNNDKSLLKPFYTSETIDRYFTRPINTSWIIYTDSSFRDTSKMSRYPGLKKHLDSVKKAITSDNRPYGLHRAREEHFFTGEKIVSLRKCVDRPLFSYSDFDCYVSAMYYVIQTDRWNMKFLTGVLNSKLVAFWLRHKGKMQGSNYQIDKEPLLGIPLPDLPRAEQRPISSLVDRILSAKASDPSADTSALESQIDSLVYRLYGLTSAEIATVEESTK